MCRLCMRGRGLRLWCAIGGGRVLITAGAEKLSPPAVLPHNLTIVISFGFQHGLASK